MLSRLLEAHEIILTDAHDAAARIAVLGDDGTNDLIISDLIRTGEKQAWFLAEHLVETPPHHEFMWDCSEHGPIFRCPFLKGVRLSLNTPTKVLREFEPHRFDFLHEPCKYLVAAVVCPTLRIRSALPRQAGLDYPLV